MTTAVASRVPPDWPGPTAPAPVRPPRRPVDLRLFAVAGGVWLASVGSLLVTPVSAWCLAGGGALVAIVVGLVAGRTDTRADGGAPDRPGRQARHRISWIVVAGLIGLVCGAAATAARTTVRDGQPLAGLARAHAAVQAELTLTDDPRPIRSAGPGPPKYAVAADLTRLEAQHRSIQLDVRVLLIASGTGWPVLLPGQRVSIDGVLAPPDPGGLVAAVVRATTKPDVLGRAPWIQRAAGRLRAGLQAACRSLPVAPGGLLPGLVIGDTSRLPVELGDDFRVTGLTHVVAVSGTNLAVVLGLVLFLTRRCRAGPWLSTVVCSVAVVGFVVLARPSPSVLRAAAMGLAGLVALATGRPRSAAPSLAAATMIVLFADPALALDAGFALSVFATAGLILLAPGWRDALRARGVPRVLAEALAVPAAAQVACAPVIAGISGTLSTVAIPANLLAVPAVAPATVLGVLAAVVSPLWPVAAGFLAWLASWPARWLILVAQVGAHLPDASLAWPAGVTGALLLAGATGFALLVARRQLIRRLAAVVVVAAALGSVPVHVLASGWPPRYPVVVACDVGQGDALAIPLGGPEAVVVDAGPDPPAVDRCLSGLGVRVVPVLLITHFHADHVDGVSGVLAHRRVGAIVVPGLAEPAAGARLLDSAAATAGVPVGVAPVGWTYARGDVEMQLIGPTRRLTGTSSDPNNNSLVVRVRARGISVLLPGDAQTEEQDTLVSDVDSADLRAVVLKVAHHGSAFQSDAFLAAAHPTVALVSVGAGNRYGHPNAALLARLARGGARVWRTDTDGDLGVVVTPDGVGVVTHPHDRVGHRAVTASAAPFAADAMAGSRMRRWPRGSCGTRLVPAGPGRRGAARVASGGRRNRRDEGGRCRHHHGRVPGRRDESGRSRRGGQPVAVRGPPGGRHPGCPGCPEGDRGRTVGVCHEP
jgi:competence protein ComEC